MKNKVSLWPFLASCFSLGLFGLWALAYWSSPEQSVHTSRSTASTTRLQLLKKAKLSKVEYGQKKDIAKRSPQSHSWFLNAKQQVYEGKSFLVSQEVYALSEDLYHQQGEVVKRDGGWVFFKTQKREAQGFRVWLNSNNQEVLIQTGRLLVDLDHIDSLQRLQEDYKLEVFYQAPGRASFFLKGPREIDPLELQAELEREVGVERAELELIGPPLKLR